MKIRIINLLFFQLCLDIKKKKKTIKPIFKNQKYDYSEYLNVFNDIKEHISKDDFEKYNVITKKCHDSYYPVLFDFKYFCAVYSYDEHRDYLKYFQIKYSKDFEDLIELWLLNGLIDKQNLNDISGDFFTKMLKYGYDLFSKVKNPTEEEELIAIENCSENILYIENKNETHIKKAIEEDWNILFEIDSKLITQDIANYAVEKNYNAITALREELITIDLIKKAIIQNKEVFNIITDAKIITQIIEEKLIPINDIAVMISKNNELSSR